MIKFITPPLVSIPMERGATSISKIKSSFSFLVPSRIDA